MRAGIEPLMRKRALHHSSLESQTVYIQPGVADVTKACDEATIRLESNLNSNSRAQTYSDWRTLTATGFKDIDPNGLYTGSHPVFGK